MARVLCFFFFFVLRSLNRVGGMERPKNLYNTWKECPNNSQSNAQNYFFEIQITKEIKEKFFRKDGGILPNPLLLRPYLCFWITPQRNRFESLRRRNWAGSPFFFLPGLGADWDDKNGERLIHFSSSPAFITQNPSQNDGFDGSTQLVFRSHLAGVYDIRTETA